MLTRLINSQGLSMVISEMQRMVNEAATDEEFLVFARSIVAESPFFGNDQLKTILEYVKSHVIYQLDPDDAELLTSPHRMMLQVKLGAAYGDCDCQAMFCVAICRALGYDAHIVLLDQTGLNYTHAAAEVYSGENKLWYYMDSTILENPLSPASDKVVDEPGALYLPGYKRKLVVA